MHQHTVNSAAVAGPPSPLKPDTPLPAMVEIIPDVLTMRMVWFRASDMYKLLFLSKDMATGSSSLAAVACPPSPLWPCMPLPATVVMVWAERTENEELKPKNAIRVNSFFINQNNPCQNYCISGKQA